MKTNFFELMVEKIVEKNAKVGMELTLKKEKIVCVDVNNDKFIFDNGSVFTKHDIISNIVKCQSKKEEWKIA